MKANKWIALLMIGAALSATPAFAQRSGRSGGSIGGGRSSSSMGGGYGGSRVSSSRSSSSYSAPSRSSSSYSSSSRSSSYSSSSSSSRSYSSPSRSNSYSSSSSSSRSLSGVSSRENSRAVSPRAEGTSRSVSGTRPSSTRMESSSSRVSSSAKGSPVTGGRGVRPGYENYARPTHPHAPLPPAYRPIHPAPYFHHPIHHCVIHMHPIFWDPFLPPVVYWPGLWGYCVGYWAGRSCTDVVVVREYVKETHHVNMISYVMSGDLMYALIEDEKGDTYMRVFDKNDNMLAQHPVSGKYCTAQIDENNGGCWIMKKGDKDPLLFLYSEGELLIYEADE